MANPTEDRATVRKPPSLASDAVACLVLFAVGNVSASVIWQHHYAHAATARAINVRTYAATPAPTESWPSDELAAATACVPPQGPIPDSDHVEGDDADSARPAPTPTKGACPDRMLLVDGLHCANPVHECLDYLSVERDRCKLYVSNSVCLGARRALRFCIDEFEYPNQPGAKPMVWVSYREAAEHCAKLGKRLCDSREWELACEGPEHLPYATGYFRDSSRCNFDRPNIVADQDALTNPSTRDGEFARVDQREPSGARPDCVSYYGVYDLTGNVDEWVVFEQGHYQKAPFRSALKGGYWGRVRNRCRPTTTDHNEWHSGYQVGFRCCTAAALE